MALRFPDAYSERLAEIESSKNPLATNPSGAKGLFQIMPPTAKQYGVNDPFDIQQQFKFERQFRADNKRYVEGKLGREISYGEQYLAHQQGMGGAVKLLSNPEGNAAETVGKQRVLQNGGNESMTNQEFANLWIDKFEKSPLIAPSNRRSNGIQVASADAEQAQLLYTSMSGSFETAPTSAPMPQGNPRATTAAYNASADLNYTVKAGDTLTEIFMEHRGLDAQAAYKEALEYAAENGFDANVIQVEQTINLSGDISATVDPASDSPVVFETPVVAASYSSGVRTALDTSDFANSFTTTIETGIETLSAILNKVADALGLDDIINAPSAPEVEQAAPPSSHAKDYGHMHFTG